MRCTGYLVLPQYRLKQTQCDLGACMAGTAGHEDFHSLIYPAYLLYLAAPSNKISPAVTLTP